MSPQAKCMVGCSWWDNLLRRPSVWVTTLANGDYIAAVVNWREINWKNYEFKLEDLGIKMNKGNLMQIREIIDKEDLGLFKEKNDYTTLLIDDIPGHGIKVYRLRIL